VYFSSASASAALSEWSAKRDLRLDHPELGEGPLVFEFSARKVGPKV